MKKGNNIGVVGVFSGIIISKLLGNYFSLNAEKTVVMGIVLMFLLLVAYMAIIKKVAVALFMFIAFLPLIVSFIAMYFDKLYIGMGGILSFIIIIPILMKIVPRFVENKNK